MNDKRIDEMLKSDPFSATIWRGFLAPDVILSGKPSPPFPQLYIVNTAPTTSGGEHWCVLLVHEKYCEFFDSFGRSPIENNVFFSILRHCSRIKFNNEQYQSILARTCGHHCIFFSILRARGFSSKKIKSMYSKNLKQNDDMVFSFVWKMFGKFFAQFETELN